MCILCSFAGVEFGGIGCSETSDVTAASSANVTLSAPAAFSLGQIIQQLRTQWGGSFEGSTFGWSNPGTGAINYFIGGTPYPSGSSEFPSGPA